MIKLIYFTADWCSPCKTLKPIMQELFKENPHIIKTIIDIDKNEYMGSLYKIKSIPTIIFEKNGTESIRVTGAMSKSYYQNIINSL